MFVRCLVCVVGYGGSYGLIGGDIMMIGLWIVVILFAILLVVTCAVAFREASQDVRDVFCSLAMLVVSVVLVLVFIVKGF